MDISTILKNIPLNRLLIYLVVLGIIPLFLLLFLFIGRLDELDELENSIQGLQTLAFQKEKKQSVNKAVKSHFSDADHFYIDKNLENLRFLLPEIENLEEIIRNPHFTEDEGMRKRLEFLTGPQNRLRLSESGVQSTAYFQEVIETLVHPVEVDSVDLKKILSLIEGVEIDAYKPLEGRPQLVILDFKLNKKSGGPNNDTFELNMKLLKREFQ